MSQLSLSPPLRRVVNLLGGIQVLSDGKSLKVPEGKAATLFAYLILNPDVPHRREQLVERFWEDTPPDRGSRRLSNTLYHLQKELGDGWLERDSTTIALNRASDLTVDVWQFEQWATYPQVDAWHQAIHLYRGDLLPEIYEDWLLPQRVRVRDIYLDLLLKVAQHAERLGNIAQALEWYRRLAAVEPLYEEGQRGVIRALLGLERATEAFVHYQAVEQQLQAELGVPPSLLTQSLGDQAQREMQSRTLLSTTYHPFVRPPFIGRSAERTRLLATLQQAMVGQGGIALLLGEAGVGKSRLLEEVATAALWRGWQVAWGYGQELTLPSPYTPLQEALVAALPAARCQQLTHLVQPLWFNVIARAFPTLAERFPASTLQEQEFYTPERLALAVQRLLEGLQQITPHLFILDDVQWADDGFWELMRHLRKALTYSHCLMIVAGRIEELQATPERWAIVEEWSQYAVSSLTLEGLTMTDLQVLARAVAPTQAGSDHFRTQLHHASNGNPLLALAMLQSANDTPAGATPPPLRALFQRRIAGIRPTARNVLEAAAVLGYRFRYDHLVRVLAPTGIPTSDVLTTLGELEQQGMVLLEAEGYRFQHDTLRRTLYEGMERTVQQSWHRYVLATLQQEQHIAPTRLLHHAEQSQTQEAIGQYALAAGQVALNGYAMASASHYFTQALAHLPVNALSQHYQAILGRLQAENILGNRAAQQRDLGLLRDIAEQSHHTEWQAEIREQEVYYYWSIGAFQEAATTIEQGLEVYAERPNFKREAALRVVLGRVVREWGHYQEAQAQITLARSLYQQLRDREGEATATDLLGGIAWQMGKHQLGAELHQQAAEMFRATGNIIREAQALNNLGANLWSLERYLEAHTTHERALPLCREQGHRRGEADNLDNMGGVSWILGDYEEAIRLYSEALALRRALNDRWGMAISYGNLGSAYRLWGKADESLSFYGEALALNEALSRKHGLGYALHGQGLAFLDLDDFPSAQSALQRATEIRATLTERQHWVESMAGLVLVYLAMGKNKDAERTLASTLDALPLVTRAAIRQWVQMVAYSFYRQQGAISFSHHHLQAAHQELLTVAGSLPPAERAGFLERVPLNREVQRAIAEGSHQVSVPLVAAHVPLGRKLTRDDYVNVTWTLYSPLDDEIPNKGERRRHILQRLITEAILQGATPSDDDLAIALRVATRTIERDLAMLTAKDIRLPTRRRK